MTTSRQRNRFVLVVTAASVALALTMTVLVWLAAGDTRPGIAVTLISLLFLAAVFVAVCVAAARKLSRREMAPLESLTAAAENATAGDLETPIPTDQPQTLTRIAEAMDTLRAQLRVATKSRDYLYELIDSMSEAVIVSDLDGVVKGDLTALEHLGIDAKILMPPTVAQG